MRRAGPRVQIGIVGKRDFERVGKPDPGARAGAVVKAGAAVPMTSRFEVYSHVLEVGDRAYEETLGYQALGRSVIAGLRLSIGAS